MKLSSLLYSSVTMLAIATALQASESSAAPHHTQKVTGKTSEVAHPLKTAQVAAGVKPDAAFRDALAATYQDNPRIIAQRKAFGEAGERFNESIAGWLPNISANYDKGRRRNGTGSGKWKYIDSRDRRLSIVQPIFSGGETYYSTSQAQNNIGATGAQLISTTQDVLGAAITAYLNVVRDRKILELSNHNVTVLEKHLKASHERFDAGEATKTDVSQSEARLSRAQSDAINAQGSVISSEADFEQSVGYMPMKELDYPAMLPVIPTDSKQTIDIALKNNPRIITAGYVENAADDNVGINIARILPEVSLRADAVRTDGASVSGVNYDTDSLLVDVNIPIYQGGGEYARVREAKIAKSRRRYELLQTTHEIRQQAIEAWERYQTATADITAQNSTIKAAEVALDGVQQEQLYGSRTLLDVLDAEQELFVARVNLERSQRNRLVAVYNLLSITGQLSPANLKLGVEEYDTQKAQDEIKYQFIGF